MHIRRARRGQALVETALVLPVLLMILFITADLARALMAQVCLMNAAREGARYACGHPTDTNGIKLRVEAEVSGAAVLGTAIVGSEITVSTRVDPTPLGGTETTVTVTYPFPLLMGYLLNRATVTVTGACTWSVG